MEAAIEKAIRTWAEGPCDSIEDLISSVRAIMQDRADRASQEERIREDERDRLYAKAREDRDRAWPDPRAWDACEWLSEEGAIHPIDRARLRGAAS